MERMILRIYDFFAVRRRGLGFLLAAVVAISLAASARIRFGENIAGFLPETEENARINYAYSHIAAADRIVVNIAMRDSLASPDESRMIQAADMMEARLADGDAAQYVEGVTCRVDRESIAEVMRFVVENMPYFLTEEDYARMERMVSREAVREAMERGKGLLSTPVGAMLGQQFVRDPLFLSGPLLERLQCFRMGGNFEVRDDHIFSADGREVVMTLASRFPMSDTAGNGLLTEALDEAAAEVEREFPELRVTPFGGAYIAVGNARQIRRDSVLSIVLAVVLILALLIYFFRSGRCIVMTGAAILFGWIFAFGGLALLCGEVSIIAVGAGSIIVGIAANYPLHFLSHTSQGYSPRRTLADISSPLTTGNVTTVGAFLSLLFISSSAMRDLGLFASLLLVGTILFVLLFLPHLMPSGGKVRARLAFGRLASSRPERNGWIVMAVAVVTLVLALAGGEVAFDTDMRNINYMTPDQRSRFGKMLRQTQGSEHLLYAVAEARTLDEALENYERTMPRAESAAREADSTLGVSGIGAWLPSKAEQRRRLERWNDFRRRRGSELLRLVDEEAVRAGFREGAFDGFRAIVEAPRGLLEAEDFGPVMDNFAANYLSIGRSGSDKSLVYTFMHVSPDRAEAVEETVNGVDESLFAFDSGTMTRRMVAALSADFDFVLWVCGFMVFAFLTLSFGRLELSLISFLPLAVSWVWILGIMHLCGMGFNIVNIILATFIFGMGDDYTIFMTEGMMYEYAYRRRMLATYKNTVALSALIMFIGIGTLIFAKHPAMRSLAEVTIVGMFSVVLTAYVIPAWCFRRLTVKHGVLRDEPLTLKNWSATVLSFAAFLLGSLAITAAGFFLLTLGNARRNRLRYHRFMQHVCGWVLRHVPHTRLIVENPAAERFEKPAMIISNHQSHLDLMAMIMLTPKIVVVTNKWVWRSPFYGLLIRYADFMPMDSVMESEGREKLRRMVDDGYSVMIFPEGTRSEEGRIGRFHRGAFFLAAELGLDIVPVLLHGFGYVLPKRDLLLRKGTLSVRIMERMKCADLGGSCGEQARRARAMYRELYDALCRERETVDYYADRVLHNYIYKGAAIEREARARLRSCDCFRRAVELLPVEGRALIVDTGRGELPLMAALVRKGLHVTAVIADDDDRALAGNCISRPSNLTFAAEVPAGEEFDAAIVADRSAAAVPGGVKYLMKEGGRCERI